MSIAQHLVVKLINRYYILC